MEGCCVMKDNSKLLNRKFFAEAPEVLQAELLKQADAGVVITIKVATKIAGDMIVDGAGKEVIRFFRKYNSILTSNDRRKLEDHEVVDLLKKEAKKNKNIQNVPCGTIQAESQEKGSQETIQTPEVGGVDIPTESGRVVAYMRLSRPEAMDNNGFRRQMAIVEPFKPTTIYQDVISGAIKKRPELDKMLDELQEGDVVIIPSVDRLSRSTLDLLDLVDTIKGKGAMLKSVNEPWLDTTSSNPMASFLLTIMGAFSQLERDMIAERIQKGCEVARQNGVKFGRPLKNGDQVNHAIDLYKSRTMSTRQIEKATGVSRSTLMRRVKQLKEKGEL